MESGTAQTPIESGLVARIKNILTRPDDTWDQIDTEPTTTGQLYRSYILPLAAIPPVAQFIGAQVFGTSILGVTIRPGFGSALASAVISYVLSLVAIYVMALIIDTLAPTFQGVRDRMQALKVAAYSATAAWIAGIFQLIPAISLLSLLGLYSLYLLYVGLPKLMKAPQQKALPYTAVAIVISIVMWLVIGSLTAWITPQTGSGKIRVGSDSSVEIGSLEDASRQMQAMAEALEKGENVKATEPERLQSLLPSSFAGLSRVSLESSAGSVGAIGGSSVTAKYENDSGSATVQITDLAAMGGFAALGSALNIESNRTTATGYERVGKVDGRMVTESWDEPSRTGSYSVVVGNRFVVQADSQGIDMNDLKKAIQRIDLKNLEKLAR